ncbi:hypothetical protein [Nocardia iowensis]|uniref:Uncharacterized protein n=1 Tax=Nocardia iowensis TaxID=204891 RepID=A0ABX8RYM4_NOCIO|nr:hypothetical protein [Nocardia iowensis]QXN94733.1 hypothetical protein KV110_17790 [Nocardia iowensis]
MTRDWVVLHGKRVQVRGRRIQGFMTGAAEGRRDAAECVWEPIGSPAPPEEPGDHGGRHLGVVR